MKKNFNSLSEQEQSQIPVYETQENGLIVPDYLPKKRAKRAGRTAMAGAALVLTFTGLEKSGAVELDELVVVVQETAGEVADELTE